MQLASFGSKVIERRAAFVRQLNDIIGAIHYRLSGGKEEIRVVYEPDVTEENFEEQLKRNQERDIRMKMTGTGLTETIFSFLIGEVDIRKFGSQGSSGRPRFP